MPQLQPPKPQTFPPIPEFYGSEIRPGPAPAPARPSPSTPTKYDPAYASYMAEVKKYLDEVQRNKRYFTPQDPLAPQFSQAREDGYFKNPPTDKAYVQAPPPTSFLDQVRKWMQGQVKGESKLDPLIRPTTPSPHASAPWGFHEPTVTAGEAVGPLAGAMSETLADPRNAWMGLGPMAGAVKGSRLIKPLVEAEKLPLFANPALPATAKTLKRGGSEAAAKILDYDPQLGYTTNPVWGSRNQTAESFHEAGITKRDGPVTPDEIVAAQNILKQLAQQNTPPMTTLYRGGEPIRHAHLNPNAPYSPNTPVPVTSDLTTATQFAMANAPLKQPLFELQVPRADLLANIEKLQRGRGYKESEYLIPLRAFQNAQTRLPFENPSINSIKRKR